MSPVRIFANNTPLWFQAPSDWRCTLTTTFAPVQLASLTCACANPRCHPIDILDNVIKVQSLAINV